MNFNRDDFRSIYAYVESLPAVSDHEHHYPDSYFARSRMTLDELMNESYVNWTGYRLDGTEAARAALLDNVRFNSYFLWLEKGVQAMHDLDGPIAMENWLEVSAMIERAYAADKGFHWRALLKHGYRRLIQDSIWDPGSDCGHPEAFATTFRIDKLLYGTHAESVAPDVGQGDINPWTHYGFSGGTFDDYVQHALGQVRKAVQNGAVALKSAEAYNRAVTFQPDDRHAAAAAFGTPASRLAPGQLMAFGNYLFNRCCELAAELDIPFQVHTGLAKIAGSQPLNLEPTIRRHTRTRFVLFHAGYPWTHQVAGLAHNYPNVCPSLTWVPLISTSAAVRTLHDFIDTACSVNTITWGSDCRLAEESVGALLAWRWTVATVLAERLADGRLARAQAELLARKLMHENVQRVYNV